MQTPPIAQIVNNAKAKFLGLTGFPAERIHVSPRLESALQRWAVSAGMVPASLEDRLQGAEIAGMEVLRMTKRSAKVEFYLSAERSGKVLSLNVQVLPEEVGLHVPDAPTIQLGDSGHEAE